MSTERILDEIKSRIDIIDVVSEYVQLRKAGQNWKGLCPFHSEKTPSFMVNPSKQIFHCFGCGAGGDVISFLEKHEHLSFREALSILARRVGISLEGRKPDARAMEKSDRIREALAEAGEFFSLSLKRSEQAREYLMGRGITEESIGRFRIGYAPQGWSSLTSHMRKKGYDDAVIRDAGLASSGQRGLYDLFRDRIIFPITGIQGNVVAFGGRALGDSMPKYLNSPETSVFRKSEMLYGLHEAKEGIRREGKVLFVEGYLDVIICHQFGFGNAVAPLGTALTEGHLSRLRKFTGQAVVVFDGDEAGGRAAKRSLPLLFRHGFHAGFLMLPSGEDPDSYLKRNGAGPFADMLNRALSAVDFLFSTEKGRESDIVREALTAIAGHADRLAAEEVLVELAGKTRLGEAAIREELKRVRRKEKTGVAGSGVSRTKAAGGAWREEILLLSALIAAPERLQAVLSRIASHDFRDAVVSSLLERMSAAGTADSATVLEGASEEEMNLYTRLSVEPGFDADHLERNIEDCISVIEERKFEEKLRRAGESGDLAQFHELLHERKKRVEGTP